MVPFSTKNTKNRTERNGLSTKSTKKGTERGWNDWKKKERGQNDLAEGPRSRTERNDLTKSRNSSSVFCHNLSNVYLSTLFRNI